MKKIHPLCLLQEFQKFIWDSSRGRRVQPGGKRIARGTLRQYDMVYRLLEQYQQKSGAPLRVQLLLRAGLRQLQKERKYWQLFYRGFSDFLYRDKNSFDQYAASVFKVLKTFFRYLAVEKGLPVGEFYKKFRVPVFPASTVILSPVQLRRLITDTAFYTGLSKSLKRVQDIFVFGCTVGLRYSDLMRLRKTHIQQTEGAIYLGLHTRKTGAEIKIPLPEYAVAIINRYLKKRSPYLLPRISNCNFNLQVKKLAKKAGWDHWLPKIRFRRGKPVELKTKSSGCWRFYDHITAHTMRRTAITTLLLLGVDESHVRRISGHTAGSREFYRYVVLVQDYLDARVKEAHRKLVDEDEILY